MKLVFISFLTSVVCLVSIVGFAQDNKKQDNKKKATLFQYGIADAFVNGLYTGEYPVRQLKREGNFGLGAPDQIDGELTINNGKVYQSKETGETILAPDSLKSSLAFVCFFKPDTAFVIPGSQTESDILQQLAGYLANKNGMYAIRISGLFHHVRTRAFPPVTVDSFPPLASMLDKQHFFDFDQVSGALIGYRMPAWLAGINIEGFHFHFISDDGKKGGHVVDFRGESIKVEIAMLEDIRVVPPKGKAFMHFNFKGQNSPALNKVERGK